MPEQIHVWEMPELIAFDGTHSAIAGRLIEFETKKSELLPDHRHWLQEKVVPAILARPNAWIDLYGYASKLGNQSDNLALSRERVESVKDFLGQHLAIHGRNIDGMVNIDCGFGETAPGYYDKDSDNSGYWRAAEIIVFGSKPSVVRPPVIPPASGNSFEIKVVAGGSASLFLQADNYVFQISDLTRRQTAFFFYTGGGLGISIPKIPGPGSMTKAGPPTPFRTSRPAELHQFNSKASLYQDPGMTVGPFSAGGTLRLRIYEIHDSTGLVFTSPSILPIEGGWGIQMPGLGSASEGILALASAVFPSP
ncbi:MAG: hypothetical protein AB7D06_16490 [Pedobacter sp.]